MTHRSLPAVLALVGLFAFSGLVHAAPQSYGGGRDDRVVHCESDNNRYRECAVGSRGRASLVRQLSSARCIEGDSWGQRGDAIWVDRGCRGEFAVGGGWNGSDPGWTGGDRFRCESDNGRSRTCRMPSRGDAVLVRQLSRTDCREGQNWGQDRDSVWVSHGCRGEFTVRGGRGNGGWGQGGWQQGQDDVFRCESDKGRTRQCAVNARRVQLLRQLSNAPCVEGRSWGQDRRGVWVSDGCRAEFRAW